MNDTQTVHFRVGADFGITLMEIANEHLLYGNDLDKALSVFSDSFGGDVPEDLVKQLLSGEMIVLVDEDAQIFNVDERIKYPHLDKVYPAKIDFHEFVIDKQKELDENTKNLDSGLDVIINKFRYKTNYSLDIPIEVIMKYVYGNDKEFIADMMDELRYDDDIQQMKALMIVTKDFIEKSLKLSAMIRRLDEMYVKDNGEKVIQHEFNTYELTNLVQKVQTIARAEFYTFTEGDDAMLNSYMEASKEIDIVLDKAIEPVDIMDNWSAGWLSPEADYYALNGEIANMLHNQIGVALQEKGIIPTWDEENTEELGMELNPDSWLEQQGWVKIHGNNIQFAGCLNSKLGLSNVHMTTKQKNLIYKYIMNCHGGVVRAGWRLEKVSAIRFKNTDDFMLSKQYFSFD